MAKISHKALVNVYKNMGYCEYEVYPDLQVTVMCANSGDHAEYMTIIKSQWFNGRYNHETGKVE